MRYYCKGKLIDIFMNMVNNTLTKQLNVTINGANKQCASWYDVLRNPPLLCCYKGDTT